MSSIKTLLCPCYLEVESGSRPLGHDLVSLVEVHLVEGLCGLGLLGGGLLGLDGGLLGLGGRLGRRLLGRLGGGAAAGRAAGGTGHS